MQKHKMVKEILYDFKQIEEAAVRVAASIDKIIEKSDKTPILVGVLKGAIPFYSLVLKHIKGDILTDFMLVKSYYGGMTSTGSVRIILDLKTDVSDREVILVEDIVDTGRTLNKLKQLIKTNGAKNVHIATMLDKPSNREVELVPDFIGYTIPNHFVIGFGLDLNEKLRNLPYIATCNTDLLEEFANEE